MYFKEKEYLCHLQGHQPAPVIKAVVDMFFSTEKKRLCELLNWQNKFYFKGDVPDGLTELIVWKLISGEGISAVRYCQDKPLETVCAKEQIEIFHKIFDTDFAITGFVRSNINKFNQTVYLVEADNILANIIYELFVKIDVRTKLVSRIQEELAEYYEPGRFLNLDEQTQKNIRRIFSELDPASYEDIVKTGPTKEYLLRNWSEYKVADNFEDFVHLLNALAAHGESLDNLHEADTFCCGIMLDPKESDMEVADAVRDLNPIWPTFYDYISFYFCDWLEEIYQNGKFNKTDSPFIEELDRNGVLTEDGYIEFIEC